MDINKIKAHLIDEGYNQQVLLDMINNGNSFQGINLRQLYAQLCNRYIFTFQELDMICILAQILTSTDNSLTGIHKCDTLCDSARLLILHGQKNTQTFHRSIKILVKAVNTPTAPWYQRNHQFLLELSSMPSLFGFSQQLAQKEIANFACDKLTKITKVDLIMGTADYIEDAIKCFGKSFPPEILKRIHHILDFLENCKSVLPPQFKGKLYFLQGFMLHYFGKKDKGTFQKIVQIYTNSLESGQSAHGLNPQIQTGKYATIFHFARLLKQPESFGFINQLKNQGQALQLQKIKDELMKCGKASYRYEIMRCVGFQPQRRNSFNSQQYNYSLGQTDSLDENLTRAMEVIECAIQAAQGSQEDIAEFQSYRTWLYLDKGHLFQNSYEKAILEITSCLNLYLKFLNGKTDRFDLRYLKMAIKVLETPQCQSLPQIFELEQVFEIIQSKFSPKVTSWITDFRQKYSMKGEIQK